MGFPAGMQLATVAFGIPLTVTGKEVVTHVTVKPTSRVIWAATGQPLPEFSDSFTAEAGQIGQFQVPFIDQGGFIDSAGNTVTDWAYQISASWSFGNERPITWAKSLKPLLGQTGPIDLDLVPDGAVSIPVTAPTAAVLGFNGRTGFITLQDSDLPARLSVAELSATYLDKTTAAATYTKRTGVSGAFGAIVDNLRAGQSAAWINNGNSLWNATDEPIYMTADGLGDIVPGAHVMWEVWDGANERHGPWSAIQEGPLGERHALFAGNSRTMYTAAANISPVTGDFQIDIDLAAIDYTPGIAQCVASRFGAAGSRAWKLNLNTAGAVDFTWSPDGTALIQKVSTATGYADGARGWLHVTLDVDNGSGGYIWKAYKSPDGVTLTEIGSSVDTTSGVTQIFNPTAQEYEIGGRGFVGEPFAGKIYKVQIRDGIGGKIVNPQPIDSWVPRSLSGSNPAPTFGGSPTLYVVNSAHPGGSMAYLSDATRMPKMNPPYSSALVTFGEMHNEGDKVGPLYLAALDSWFAALKSRLPGCAFATTTENPQTAPRTVDVIRPQEQRRREVMSWAARNGVYVLDTWQALLDDGRPLSELITTVDGIHWIGGMTGGAGVATRVLLGAFEARL